MSAATADGRTASPTVASDMGADSSTPVLGATSVSVTASQAAADSATPVGPTASTEGVPGGSSVEPVSVAGPRTVVAHGATEPAGGRSRDEAGAASCRAAAQTTASGVLPEAPAVSVATPALDLKKLSPPK
ncbi:hypothetical protein, partial [Streptomyces europaeiscabiei]|uniref:hypothetical protein n=1 Tax=Streptomyces europaeiscabiei TaxID=146819 RepID=UPI0029AA473F|nr:hypothetical protein [Streptomyces europaeiscabiei]